MEYHFCPACGDHLVTRTLPNDKRERQGCASCAFVLYRNSRPSASAIVLRDDGHVLMVRRKHAPFQGQWELPGGFLEVGEHPQDGVVREVEEETGLTVKPRRLVGIYMDEYETTGDCTLNTIYVA